ncbi:hypothetical protein DBB34_18225 [Sphaerisporangium cinnabarinum]|nr:hypothetical protein DBB34_18225 [Sphaerisporangium cinnabarinum]
MRRCPFAGSCGSGVSGLGSRVWGLGSGVSRLASRVSRLASRVSRLASRVSRLASRVSRRILLPRQRATPGEWGAGRRFAARRPLTVRNTEPRPIRRRRRGLCGTRPGDSFVPPWRRPGAAPLRHRRRTELTCLDPIARRGGRCACASQRWWSGRRTRL